MGLAHQPEGNSLRGLWSNPWETANFVNNALKRWRKGH